ncbi:hypothetical protein DUNSADRAFT_18623 [Dunaliella salina]|uniref:Uncharacterized protein n=1 Tax=Dunaliella salina TaxID=3046 RepID=A0ABQ7FZS6_DUNSA|nr:hypothetical protein DUNSADRAFT_18623 [Dunaliella salina]|eukprot:KAF5827848.1 hypothetical protein DUNSADRAFT_18623 [Dunaliella salina]
MSQEGLDSVSEKNAHVVPSALVPYSSITIPETILGPSPLDVHDTRLPPFGPEATVIQVEDTPFLLAFFSSEGLRTAVETAAAAPGLGTNSNSSGTAPAATAAQGESAAAAPSTNVASRRSRRRSSSQAVSSPPQPASTASDPMDKKLSEVSGELMMGDGPKKGKLVDVDVELRQLPPALLNKSFNSLLRDELRSVSKLFYERPQGTSKAEHQQGLYRLLVLKETAASVEERKESHELHLVMAWVDLALRLVKGMRTRLIAVAAACNPPPSSANAQQQQQQQQQQQTSLPPPPTTAGTAGRAVSLRACLKETLARLEKMMDQGRNRDQRPTPEHLFYKVMKKAKADLLYLEWVLDQQQQMLVLATALHALATGRARLVNDVVQLQRGIRQERQQPQHVFFFACVDEAMAHHWKDLVTKMQGHSSEWRELLRALGPFYAAPGQGSQVIAAQHIEQMFGLAWAVPGGVMIWIPAFKDALADGAVLFLAHGQQIANLHDDEARNLMPISVKSSWNDEYHQLNVYFKEGVSLHDLNWLQGGPNGHQIVTLLHFFAASLPAGVERYFLTGSGALKDAKHAGRLIGTGDDKYSPGDLQRWVANPLQEELQECKVCSDLDSLRNALTQKYHEEAEHGRLVTQRGLHSCKLGSPKIANIKAICMLSKLLVDSGLGTVRLWQDDGIVASMYLTTPDGKVYRIRVCSTDASDYQFTPSCACETTLGYYPFSAKECDFLALVNLQVHTLILLPSSVAVTMGFLYSPPAILTAHGGCLEGASKGRRGTTIPIFKPWLSEEAPGWKLEEDMVGVRMNVWKYGVDLAVAELLSASDDVRNKAVDRVVKELVQERVPGSSSESSSSGSSGSSRNDGYSNVGELGAMESASHRDEGSAEGAHEASGIGQALEAQEAGAAGQAHEEVVRAKVAGLIADLVKMREEQGKYVRALVLGLEGIQDLQQHPCGLPEVRLLEVGAALDAWKKGEEVDFAPQFSRLQKEEWLRFLDLEVEVRWQGKQLVVDNESAGKEWDVLGGEVEEARGVLQSKRILNRLAVVVRELEEREREPQQGQPQQNSLGEQQVQQQPQQNSPGGQQVQQPQQQQQQQQGRMTRQGSARLASTAKRARQA